MDDKFICAMQPQLIALYRLNYRNFPWILILSMIPNKNYLIDFARNPFSNFCQLLHCKSVYVGFLVRFWNFLKSFFCDTYYFWCHHYRVFQWENHRCLWISTLRIKFIAYYIVLEGGGRRSKNNDLCVYHEKGTRYTPRELFLQLPCSLPYADSRHQGQRPFLSLPI